MTKPLVALLALAMVGAPLVSVAAPCHPGGADDGDCCLRNTEHPVETPHMDDHDAADHGGPSQDADSCSRDCHLITPAVAVVTSQRPVPLILEAIAVSGDRPQARSFRIEHVPLIP